MILAGCNTNDADDELSKDHAQSTPYENAATTIRFDHVETKRGGEDIDEGGDLGDQERVADCA